MTNQVVTASKWQVVKISEVDGKEVEAVVESGLTREAADAIRKATPVAANEYCVVQVQS